MTKQNQVLFIKLILLKDKSTFVFNTQEEKSIDILLLRSFFINGDKHVR